MKDTNILITNGVDLKEGLNLFGDIDLYNESLMDFLAEIDSKLYKIAHFKEGKDLDNYAILVHSLKSDAQYFGFEKLANLSYDHEMASKKGNLLYVNANYTQLINEANKMVAITKEYLSSDSEKKKENNNLEKVLLVADDSEIIQKIINRALEEDYKIVKAYNGEEAIQHVKNKDYNVIGVLLDLNMPDVDGFAVLKYFKEHNLFKQIPVSIITGNDSKDIDMDAFTYPIVDIIKKPFSENSLKSIINKMIDFKGRV